MNKDTPTTRAAERAIAEEAAEWFIEWREAAPSKADKLRFADWLSESPVHVEKYLAIAKAYGVLGDVDPPSFVDAEQFIDDTIVALHGDLDTDPAPAPDLSPRRRWVGWSMAASVVLAIAAAALFIPRAEPEVYATALGEQRSVILADGSMVSLNTQSRLEVAYAESERLVRLTQGEALFEVEEDLERPFLVETASALIRVTGTQFNVYQSNGETAVTVIEGTVEVAPKAQPVAQRAVGPSSETSPKSAGIGRGGEVATLAVGDQVVVKSGSEEIAATRVDNLEPVTAWTERRLMFDATPLGEIVAEFNRYNRQRLVIDDASLNALELSGVFNSHDPETLTLYLERIADIEVVASDEAIWIRATTSTP